MLLTIIVAFISLIALIIIHEFGHFILAKKFGAKVEEFGIGFPPRLFGKKIGETVYSLNLLPLGAFVSIQGEQGGVEDYRSFIGKPIWQRYLIVLGGVVAFWLTAVIVLSIVAGVWGLPVGVSDEANGELIDPKVQITSVIPNEPAEAAGLRSGDIIVGFDKVKDFQEFIKAHQHQEIGLSIKRGDEILEKNIMIEDVLGVGLLRTALKPYPWYSALWGGTKATADLTANIVYGWGVILGWSLGLSELPEGIGEEDIELMGPLGIFNLLREYFALGANYFLYLVSLIAVALALVNILPIPALDGGKIVFLTIEAIRGKAINHKIEQKITTVCFVLLIALIIFITIQFDIPRLF